MSLQNQEIKYIKNSTKMNIASSHTDHLLQLTEINKDDINPRRSILADVMPDKANQNKNMTMKTLIK